MIRWDGRWTSRGRADGLKLQIMGGGWDGGARSKGMIRWDGRWTSRGRAKAAEIAWEEARDGGARSKGMIRWDGRWTSRGRAKAAEIAEEALGTEERD